MGQGVITSGILVIDKPSGMTSHDVVNRVRRILGQKRVGHAGTLDPDATGVLVILLGTATKKSALLSQQRKIYRGEMVLGIETDTLDASGKVVRSQKVKGLPPVSVKQVFEEFRGTMKQTPPVVSAIKVGGTPLYKLARRDPELNIEPPPRDVTIYRLDVLDLKGEASDHPRITFEVDCSKGTYVRSLARDIGARLGTGAHLADLVRLASGRFTLKEAHTLDEIQKLVEDQQLSKALVEDELSKN